MSGLFNSKLYIVKTNAVQTFSALCDRMELRMGISFQNKDSKMVYLYAMCNEFINKFNTYYMIFQEQ